MSYNVAEDLEYRPDSEKLEIISISGPRAQQIMQRLVDGERDFLESEYYLDVTEEDVQNVIAQYSRVILR
jgi:glycine cleavage system aminomethyltransferase T